MTFYPFLILSTHSQYEQNLEQSVTRKFDYTPVFIHRVFPAIMSLPYRYHSS